jgi:hypothetical protein
MNYILTESQLKVIVENQSQLQYLKRILPGKFAEVVRYVKSKRNYRELGSSEFITRFISVLMDVLHPYLIGKYGTDWNYDLFERILTDAYHDDVMKLWEKIHE